ncbi:MAG: hypothetical protein DRI74_08960 [Bacteroidetes bacterium]|nr:MAG: hypothetical protein DRI74_08960 [Bacteroidota bacterium]
MKCQFPKARIKANAIFYKSRTLFYKKSKSKSTTIFLTTTCLRLKKRFVIGTGLSSRIDSKKCQEQKILVNLFQQ